MLHACFWYNASVSVQELKEAITQLSSPELAQFTAWFEEYQAGLQFGETRLARECAKLDPQEEQAWAELAPTLRSEQQGNNYV